MIDIRNKYNKQNYGFVKVIDHIYIYMLDYKENYKMNFFFLEIYIIIDLKNIFFIYKSIAIVSYVFFLSLFY